jgi:hypothetical protein
LKTEKIRLGKPKKRRVVWGFNPSPKVVPNKKKKVKNDRTNWKSQAIDM